jgi:hypothetical protein
VARDDDRGRAREHVEGDDAIDDATEAVELERPDGAGQVDTTADRRRRSGREAGQAVEFPSRSGGVGAAFDAEPGVRSSATVLRLTLRREWCFSALAVRVLSQSGGNGCAG